MVETTTIKIKKKTKKQLDNLKVHPRETYEGVILRLFKYWREQNGMS